MKTELGGKQQKKSPGVTNEQLTTIKWQNSISKLETGKNNPWVFFFKEEFGFNTHVEKAEDALAPLFWWWRSRELEVRYSHKQPCY